MLPARAVLLPLLLGSASLAGCFVDAPRLNATNSPQDLGFGAVSLLSSGGFSMDVPIEAYFLGFDAKTVAAIAEKLPPTVIEHAASSTDRAFPPSADTTPLGGQSLPASAKPRASFHVVDFDGATEAAFAAAAEGWKVPAVEGTYDANAAEAWLAARVEDARGRPLERAHPVFVVIHGGTSLGDHAWRYNFSHGWLDRLRIFGERLPLTVFDVSAQPDPFVVEPHRSPEAIAFGTAFGPTRPADYDWPLNATGEKTVAAVAQLTLDSAHWRFLKGPTFPISTKPCHHVTLLLAVHTTAITEALPGWVRAKDSIDVESLRSAFVNLTSDDVSVDLKVLALPRDDPVLDALAREGGATLAGLDVLRWYLDENFETFVMPRQGCEEYLSLLLWGDAATYASTGGISMYDVQRSHRLSFSFVPETKRVQEMYEGPGEEFVNERNESRVLWNWATMLYAHETGHLFGQQHPQHVSRVNEGLGTSHSFEAIYSVMGYQQDDRMVDFGAVDHSTWTMGRAGYSIAEAQERDLVGSPELADALTRLAAGDWIGAHEALEARLEEERTDGSPALPEYHFVEILDHGER
ncbi:MAG: hypothetical protein WDA16_05825 [Candidatus Thermoplasmatota archaeon]